MVNGLLTLSETFYNAYPVLGEKISQLGVHLKKFISDTPVEKKTIIKNIKDVEIYIVAVEKIDKEIIDAAENLKLIVKHGAGLDNLDLEYLTQKGIPVTFTPGQNGASVADFTMALLLSAARNVPQSNQIMKNGGWQLIMGTELEEKTLGILGFGIVGKKVASRAKGFGLKIIAYDIYKDYETAQKLGVKFVDLDTIFNKSDFLSINLSLNKKTCHLIGKEEFKKMKKTSFIINTSRGPVTVEKDLIDALSNGTIAGAALDVFDSEPPNMDLISLPNVIASSHIGGSTFECAQRLGEITIDNVNRFLNGKELKYVANPDVLKKR